MSIARLKLHHYPASRSARVKWLLHEVLGEAFEVERVNLYGGQQYAPEFLRLNPNHGVPVLEIEWEDGARQVMHESAAMLAFLADAYPGHHLAPPPGLSSARADFLQMLHFGAGPIDMMLWQIRIHEHVLPVVERDPRTIARYRKKFADEIEPQLARRLTAASFIGGEMFSAADCMIGHCVFWARGYGMCRDDVFRSYISRLSKRPAFAAAFVDAKEFSPQVPQDKPLATQFTG